MTEEYGNISDGFFLSDKEVEDLRKSKKELTDYGKQKLKQMMNDNYIPDDDVIEEMLNLKLAEEKKEELERLRRKEQEKDTDK